MFSRQASLSRGCPTPPRGESLVSNKKSFWVYHKRGAFSDVGKDTALGRGGQGADFFSHLIYRRDEGVAAELALRNVSLCSKMVAK